MLEWLDRRHLVVLVLPMVLLLQVLEVQVATVVEALQQAEVLRLLSGH